MSDQAASLKVVTIGVYGFTEAAFFEELQRAGVELFCDIRWRRGVRGSEYAFVNSARLQKRLAELGIGYRHFRELAPSPAVRERQVEADERAGIAKRKRTALGEAFIEGYRRERLAGFDSRKFVEELAAAAGTVALFCVERLPEACHRSLLAEKLRQDVGVEVVHLLASGGAPSKSSS